MQGAHRKPTLPASCPPHGSPCPWNQIPNPAGYRLSGQAGGMTCRRASSRTENEELGRRGSIDVLIEVSARVATAEPSAHSGRRRQTHDRPGRRTNRITGPRPKILPSKLARNCGSGASVGSRREIQVDIEITIQPSYEPLWSPCSIKHILNPARYRLSGQAMRHDIRKMSSREENEELGRRASIDAKTDVRAPLATV